MEKYIKQLIQDLEKVANTPPHRPYIEVPPHLADDIATAEIALTPYQTIEELTGIKQEVFPQLIDLEGDQWQRVNDAIFKVFETFHLDLVDLPPYIPPEELYDILTTHWKYPVQYLPSTGMDLEFCTGNPMTCPYGEYCDCGDDIDIYELPEKFAELVNPIAQAIDAGFICYLNPETMEMEEIPKQLIDDPQAYEMSTGINPEEEELKHETWDTCYVFEPLDSGESFKIMEHFVHRMEDEILQEELFYVLAHRKPFANFKALIDNSDYGERWFSFKMNWLKDYVRSKIDVEIHKTPENSDENELPF
ncbi:MAG: hypothetical protein H0S84_08070 [Bacteroidales bacterium]|jgi:hypothetical protein|nr:hypothetical protein [Bacteroidales bacterium]